MKVLKIGAVWCSSCLVMKPKWEEVEKKYSWLNTRYYDYDNSENIVKKYNIDSGKLPVFIFLDKKGNEIVRKQGELSKKKIVELINKYKNR
jgi:thiol-disulfide isomerase/thioredoxin